MKRMSVHRVLSGLSAMLLSTVVMVGVSGASATAASASPSTPYCVASVSGTSMRCFSTFGASITYATGGRVHLANATVARHVSSAELGQGRGSSASAQPNGNIVYAIDYSGTSWGGYSLTWHGGNCYSWGGADMPAGWNDRVQSVQAYSNCATTLYWNAGYGQPEYVVGVNSGVGNLGSFNNQASSQSFCDYNYC
jgi:hypothetical protein